MSEIEELKAELQKFKDMAKKGLDEFKDVGGCWGCSLQLQLNQDTEDIKQLKAENERLKRCMMEGLHHEGNAIRETIKYKQTLQEIKAIVKQILNRNVFVYENYRDVRQIMRLIKEAEENNE